MLASEDDRRGAIALLQRLSVYDDSLFDEVVRGLSEMHISTISFAVARFEILPKLWKHKLWRCGKRAPDYSAIQNIDKQ